MYARQILLVSVLFSACTESNPDPVVRSDKDFVNPGSSTQQPVKNGTQAGKDHFLGSLVTAFRSPDAACLTCHDAPRNVKDNPDASDERIYEYFRMLSLLKLGGFSNSNAFINPLLGKTDHPGSPICVDAGDELCQLAIKWFELEFPDAKSQFGTFGGVDISFAGINVYGEAVDISNPNLELTVQAYLDGEAGVGTLVGSGVASGSGNGFNFRLQDSVRDNAEHQLYLYAVVGGKQEPLDGNPTSIVAYRPRGIGTYPGTENVIPGINGCGCHDGGISYSSLWPDLTIPIGGSGGAQAAAGVAPSARNNYLIDMATGSRGLAHPGGRVGDVDVIASWWCAEFKPNDAACTSQ